MLNKLIVLAALLLPACFANAHEYKAGELEIAHPWSQELPPNAPTVAAYFVIHNNGKTADRLLSVDSPISKEAQLHEHVMQNDLMKMQQVPSVEIPTMHFEKSGDVTVEVAVQKQAPDGMQAHQHAQ